MANDDIDAEQRAINANLYAARYEHGLDLYSGEPLTGQALEDSINERREARGKSGKNTGINSGVSTTFGIVEFGGEILGDIQPS